MTNFPRIGCVGAGSIGSSWALLFALRGHNVTLCDVSDQILERSLENIGLMLSTLCEMKAVEPRFKDDILRRITVTTELSELGSVGYVQESVIESQEAKVGIFEKLEDFVAEDALLASSTSGFSMSEIQRNLKHPERAIVAHPFNPPHLLPLVELVRGDKTSDETFLAVREFMLNLGKVPVLVRKEVVGFAANRIQVAMLREILSLLDAGVVSMEDIEKIFYAGIGLRYAVMGPFAIETVNGGPGGLEQDFKHFKPAIEQWLKSMATWNTIPASAEHVALSQVNQLSYLKTKSHEERVKWRDEELIKLLRVRGYIESREVPSATSIAK